MAGGCSGTFWGPPWGRTDFLGVDPKKVSVVFSAAQPSARPLRPLIPGPSPTRGEE